MRDNEIGDDGNGGRVSIIRVAKMPKARRSGTTTSIMTATVDDETAKSAGPANRRIATVFGRIDFGESRVTVLTARVYLYAARRG